VQRDSVPAGTFAAEVFDLSGLSFQQGNKLHFRGNARPSA
jgi:hypothetical protein